MDGCKANLTGLSLIIRVPWKGGRIKRRLAWPKLISSECFKFRNIKPSLVEQRNEHRGCSNCALRCSSKGRSPSGCFTGSVPELVQMCRGLCFYLLLLLLPFYCFYFFISFEQTLFLARIVTGRTCFKLVLLCSPFRFNCLKMCVALTT